ncbi:MAG: transposase [Cellulosilyticaceae bacterium]
MPRCARIKTNDSMFHVMTHSIQELLLFRENADKDVFLALLKKAQLKFNFKLYAFCLMDTHTHLVIDCFGADISKIMHYVNLCYCIYYNSKYERKGPLFQDRFKSRLITTQRYLVNLITYIHANPKDLATYADKLVTYPYSSLRDYIYDSNKFGILSTQFVKQLLGLDIPTHKLAYLRLLRQTTPDTIQENIELPMNKCEYRNELRIIPRLESPEVVIHYVSHKLGLSPHTVRIKYNSHYSKLRALTCFMLNSFCSFGQKQICHYLGNITQSRVSSLVSTGLVLAQENPTLISDFIAAHTL